MRLVVHALLPGDGGGQMHAELAVLALVGGHDPFGCPVHRHHGGRRAIGCLPHPGHEVPGLLEVVEDLLHRGVDVDAVSALRGGHGAPLPSYDDDPTGSRDTRSSGSAPPVPTSSGLPAPWRGKGLKASRWLVSNDRIWRPRANPTNRVARRWPHEPQNRSVDQIRSARDRSLALSDERAANDTAHLDQFSAFVGDTDVAGPCRPCTLPAHQSGSVESVTRTDRGAYGDADHLDCQALVIHRNTPVMHVAPTSRVNLRRGARAVS